MKRRTLNAARNLGIGIGLVVVLPVLFLTFNGLGGTNPVTPPGHEGYLYHQPLMVGQRHFVEGQIGPTSPGWRWRQYVTNVDMRPANYSEQMHIFSADNLEVSFEAHARIGLNEGSVQELIERYSGHDWYSNNVGRPYRTAVREVVRRHNAFDIKNQSVEIGEQILARMREENEGTPFNVISISIGNIDFPESVEERVTANLVAEQRRQRMGVQRQIAEAQAEIREIRAGGEAEAQEIQEATLTPLFVQHEAAELYGALADDTDDEDGVARARVIVVMPTRSDRAAVPRVYQGDGEMTPSASRGTRAARAAAAASTSTRTTPTAATEGSAQ